MQEQRLNGYDIIGDIHGCCIELIQLLEKLGYEKVNDVYTHPLGRTAVFVGDYIDRGPDIYGVLKIIKGMHSSGNALCIMGNHEYNACRFWKKSDNGEYLRAHNHTNIIQHYQTIKAFQNKEAEWNTYLDWFKSLPIYIDRPTFRVVHAFWSHELLTINPTINPWSEDNIELIERCLKGQDIKLPAPTAYLDKDGNRRTSARTKWWLDPTDRTYMDYIEQTVFTDTTPLQNKIPEHIRQTHGSGYGDKEKPIFFGHYWLKGVPVLQADNVCCLDYSVAKGDKLVCYRFDGEQTLKVEKIVYQTVNSHGKFDRC